MSTYSRHLAGTILLILAAMTGAALVTSGALAAPPAGTLGSLTFMPATGTEVTPLMVRTSAGCPTSSDAYTITVTGPGAWSKGFVATGTSYTISTTGEFDGAFGNTIKDIGLLNGGAVVTSGEYDITLNCNDSFTAEVKGTFTGALYFTANEGSLATYTSSNTSASTSASASASSSASASASASSSASASVSASAPVSASTTPVSSGTRTTLPVTGSPIGLMAAVGLALVAIGIGVVYAMRRRTASE